MHTTERKGGTVNELERAYRNERRWERAQMAHWAEEDAEREAEQDRADRRAQAELDPISEAAYITYTDGLIAEYEAREWAAAHPEAAAALASPALPILPYETTDDDSIPF